jgi:excisionase family DNA binding protein
VNSLSSGLHEFNGESRKTALTTSEVARIFNVHPSTIRRWCDQGKIKFHRAGPRSVRLFKREDIAVAYLDRSIRYCLKKM